MNIAHAAKSVHVERLEPTKPGVDELWSQYEGLVRSSFGRKLPDLTVQRRHGVAYLAMLREQVVGGVIVLPLRQFFGGQAIPAAGLSLLCTSPEVRGRGVAATVFAELSAHLADEGTPLISFWTPSPGVYRRWGWEVAGTTFGAWYPLEAFREMTSDAVFERDPEPASIEALRLHDSARWEGSLLQPEWWGDWKKRSNSTHTTSLGFIADGALIGYVTFYQEDRPTWGYDIVVTELKLTNAQAFGALGELLTRYRSQAERVHFLPGVLPPDPDFMWLLPQHKASTYSWYPWMLRLIDVQAALEARGWSELVDARLDLAIVGGARGDDLPLTLTVERGVGRVEPGGRSAVRMTERGLAAWYAGALSARRAADLGLLRCDPAALDLLDAVTGARDTWLADLF